MDNSRGMIDLPFPSQPPLLATNIVTTSHEPSRKHAIISVIDENGHHSYIASYDVA